MIYKIDMIDCPVGSMIDLDTINKIYMINFDMIYMIACPVGRIMI
jgi:hypothetical protein